MSVDIITQNSREDGWEFTVQTDDKTKHTVTVPAEYYQEVTGGEVSPRELVKQSFTFLLAREPAEAILSEFSLPTIENYFPEYPEAMRTVDAS